MNKQQTDINRKTKKQLAHDAVCITAHRYTQVTTLTENYFTSRITLKYNKMIMNSTLAYKITRVHT